MKAKELIEYLNSLDPDAEIAYAIFDESDIDEYANGPVSKEEKKQILEQLQEEIGGLSELAAILDEMEIENNLLI